MGAVELVEYLNKVGGENGIGLLDIVENRLVGMKSRGVYETPGGAILYKAINVLETITLDKESAHFKAQMAQKYADIVYNGQWFTPLREALDAFADSLEKTVTGDVKLKLYKGNMITPASPLRTPCTTSRLPPSAWIRTMTSPMLPASSTSSACPSRSAQSCPRTGPRSRNNLLTIPFGVFLHFTLKAQITGIIAGGTAAGAFPLRRFAVSIEEFLLWQNNFGRAVSPRRSIPASTTSTLPSASTSG